MSKTTAQLRQLWSKFACKETSMVVVPFGPAKICVAPPTAEAWEALAAVMLHHGYTIRTLDTDSYNCREITGGSGRSLHSYGIALDVNWTTNQFNDHAGNRTVRYSTKPTQDQRALDVRHGLADTDMTPEMIADVEKIKTMEGVTVFEWGGSWRSRKHCMHFELDLSPDELAKGIDHTTVAGWDALVAAVPGGAVPQIGHAVGFGSGSGALASIPDPRVVIARDGLRLRAGPTTDADIIRVITKGTTVNVLSHQGHWALVDLAGDGQADGFMSLHFLRPVGASAGPVASDMITAATTAPNDITGLVTADMVAHMFPATPRAHIVANVPFVLSGLRARALGDRPMVLMGLATIRAETEGFVPISEGRSHFNTVNTPFDRYEPGTSIGARLGNTQQGDGPRFRGRGYVQLTGRDNYTRVGGQVGTDLVSHPEAANDPTIAGLILAQFLKNHDAAIRTAIGQRDLRTARKLVNGGSHELDQFRDAYKRGLNALPA